MKQTQMQMQSTPFYPYESYFVLLWPTNVIIKDSWARGWETHRATVWTATYYMIPHTVAKGGQLSQSYSLDVVVCIPYQFTGSVVICAKLKLCLLSEKNSSHCLCLSGFSHLLHLSTCFFTAFLSYLLRSFFNFFTCSFLPLPNRSFLLYHNPLFICLLSHPLFLVISNRSCLSITTLFSTTLFFYSPIFLCLSKGSPVK